MPTPEVVRIRLMWFPQAQFAGYHLAEQRDLGLKDGVRIHCEPIEFNDPGVDALLDGRVEMAVLSPSHLLESRSPTDLRFIATIQQTSALAYPARRSAGVREPKDLVGKRVGVWPGGEDLELRWMLTKCGADIDRVARLPFADTASAFLEGKVDCAQMTIYHELAHVEHTLEAGEVVTLKAADHGASLVKDGLIARSDWLQANPEIAQAAVNAILEGWTVAFTDQAAALDACEFARPDLSREAHREQLAAIRRLALQGPTHTRGLGYPDRQHVEDALAALRGTGERIDVQSGEVWTDRFWRAAPERWRSMQWLSA
ncbi:MAG: ABC transporter substrate-binding protein [Hyphomicrobiaceae bacterium]